MMAAAMATVGSTIVASKLMGEMPVFIAAFLRFTVASPLLVGIVWLSGKRLPRLTWREWATLCIQAGLGSVGYAVLLIMGLALTRASDASVIAGTLPAVAALLSFVVLRERLGGWTILAIMLATLGVAVLSLDNPAAPGDSGQRWTGNALVLCAIVCEALFLLLNKTIKTPVDPLLVAATMSVLSLVFCAVPALFQWIHAAGPTLSIRAVGAAVYYALVPTVLGFHLWYRGASKASGAEASLFTAVYPVAGLLLSACVLGETIETQHWIGAAIAVFGIAIGAHPSRR
ncbi:DMT family transporter [Massilia antarctica]|uniref:DMT family transporter n=1 Tax=Massilia antarctica TaxID=2765360 RepID=UPI0006BB6060|nr:DMT family transporter [Massilia sp. H27-R4]MCY0915137.1 DMT family transporter [Massilia sp. H27-R4]CUI07117.1 Permease of the drug/metabolite transporter (DMT) superfamily [Janthinobacterium sp. CG23_2]CUU30903.1 Permease of the drug/metabolite transporter (DMT) superfamily [Janthinobacterium sp. CG23_2]